MQTSSTLESGGKDKATPTPRQNAPVWRRLHALQQKRLAERARLAHEAAENAAREEEVLVQARRERHRRTPVDPQEAEEFYEHQMDWKLTSQARARAQWREDRYKDYSEHRDPVISPRSQEILSRKGNRKPLYSSPTSVAQIRGETKVQSSKTLLTEEALQASVRRLSYDDLERRRRKLEALMEELDWAATEGGREAQVPLFHPRTTPHRSHSNRGTRTAEEAGIELHRHAQVRGARLAEEAAKRREERDASYPFKPRLCATSEAMPLPNRKPLYLTPSPQIVETDLSGSAAVAQDQRRLSVEELHAFYARNARLNQQREAARQSRQWASVEEDLEQCTFRPQLTPRTRQLAAARELTMADEAMPRLPLQGQQRSSTPPAHGRRPREKSPLHPSGRSVSVGTLRRGTYGVPMLSEGRRGPAMTTTELPYRSFSFHSARESPDRYPLLPRDAAEEPSPLLPGTGGDTASPTKDVSLFQSEMSAMLMELNSVP